MKIKHVTLPVLFIVLSMASLHGQITVVDTGATSGEVNLSQNYSQNFDTLASTGSNIPWTNNITLAGWYISTSTYTTGYGSSTTNAIYSFGSSGSSDRALGSLGGGGISGYAYWGVRLVNGTSTTIDSIDISYTGEQWSRGFNSPSQHSEKLAFSYQLFNPDTGSVTTTSGWSDQPSLNFTSPNATLGSGATLNGNSSGNYVTIADSINVIWNPGMELWVRWMDINDPNNDHSLAIDQLSITPKAISEPGTIGLGLSAVLVVIIGHLRRKNA